MDAGTTMTVSNAAYDHLLKIVLVGDSAVGKSNILARFSGHPFDEGRRSTIGVEFASKVTNVCGVAIKSQIWDTAGTERYRAISRSYYRGAAGVLLVFDIGNVASFENLPMWVAEVRKSADEDITIVVVGNKNDINHPCVFSNEVKAMARKEGLIVAGNCSAKTGEGIHEAFELLIANVYEHMKAKGKLNTGTAFDLHLHETLDDEKPNKTCC